MAAANASVVTANPGGTATPARASSPRDAALPPTAPASAASLSVTTKVTASVLQHADGAAVAVTPDPAPCPDPLGRVPAADDGGHPVLAGDDRRMGHAPANIRDRCLDLREH